MITRRDLVVALVAAAATAAAFTVASRPAAVSAGAIATPDRPAVMGSSVFHIDAIPNKPNDHGATRSFFSTPTATLENLELHVSTLNPGMSPHPPHRHPNEELIIIDKGTIETLSNGQWVRATVGDVVFNGSNQLHGFKNVGAEPAVYHVMNFKTAATPPGGTTFETPAKSSGN
jgi:quercetin dioxygenase-like cupin family protein